ncbi:MAG: methionyl-tRNA formyltransferase, partial [Anaerovorax sp.]
MGTPDFAVQALELLYKSEYEVVLVVTQPDKGRDRGKKVQFPPVKEKALELGLRVSQPEKIKGNEEFIEELEKLKPDLIIVAAYGKLLPKSVLEIPRVGCINIHGSLLPKYRGAAPIHWAVINGEQETGVTIMHMEEGLDCGDMISKASTLIGKKTTAMLHEELSILGAQLLLNTLPGICDGTAERVKQENEKATYAPMVFKKDGHLDFTKSPKELEQFIRGFNSWPGAYAILGEENMKIWESYDLEKENGSAIGTITKVSAQGIEVSSGGGTLQITKIQMPGKKPMMVSDYLKGNKLIEGTLLK